MKRLHLAPGLTLPLDFITMRSSVFGTSGSGKSTFGRLIAEAVHAAGQRFCVIDLKNDWWGLKSSADGKHAAIPVVVIGGPRADLPLDENAGAAVADIVAELPHSFIIDLDALSKGKGIRFLGAFLERLYDVNREPLLLICDEADRYGPQKPMSIEANVTLGAADDIARRGRKRGIGSLWLSQRPAVINKNITSQCEMVVTFRTPSELDQKELRAHIGRVASADQVEETMRRVGGMANGEAIFMSQHPALAMFKTAQLPMPQTFDSSATPKVGERRVEPKLLAAPDLAALGDRIKATVEKAKADDPRHLRARIVQLEAELRKRPEVAPPKVERVEVPVIRDAQIDRMDAGIRTVHAAAQSLTETLGEFVQAVKAAKGGLGPRAQGVSHRGVALASVAAPQPVRPVRRDPARPRPGGSLPKGERAILTACAQHAGGCTREQLTVLTGYKRSSRDTYIQRLRERGLVEDVGVIQATPEGVAELGPDFEPLPMGHALLEHWRNRLPQGERAVLEVLVSAYPEPVEREVLSEATGYQRSSRDTYLQRLRSRQLVDDHGRGQVRASEILFDGAA